MDHSQRYARLVAQMPHVYRDLRGVVHRCRYLGDNRLQLSNRAPDPVRHHPARAGPESPWSARFSERALLIHTPTHRVREFQF